MQYSSRHITAIDFKKVVLLAKPVDADLLALLKSLSLFLALHTYLLECFFICLLTHSLTHLLTHSLTYLLTYLLITIR